ncbi:unnamed protein product [Protopolystoma xenopodis]|uniref:Uncharacterized protein n=1 Tax=Protopolystoma xenopodis TaxID=117903 RepID=A0A3S5CC49_9PLAT|nr:unnamed protein product [Protopolystoma xenopodis]
MAYFSLERIVFPLSFSGHHFLSHLCYYLRIALLFGILRLTLWLEEVSQGVVSSGQQVRSRPVDSADPPTWQITLDPSTWSTECTRSVCEPCLEESGNLTTTDTPPIVHTGPTFSSCVVAELPDLAPGEQAVRYAYIRFSDSWAFDVSSITAGPSGESDVATNRFQPMVAGHTRRLLAQVVYTIEVADCDYKKLSLSSLEHEVRCSSASAGPISSAATSAALLSIDPEDLARIRILDMELASGLTETDHRFTCQCTKMMETQLTGQMPFEFVWKILSMRLKTDPS